MKLIQITQGQRVQVDDSDFEFLNRFKWCAQKDTHTYYAVRAIVKDGRKSLVKMHRVLLELVDPKIKGEHRDGNGLNNQRENLRVATTMQNSQGHRTARAKKSSRFRGVTWHKLRGDWMANIGIKGKSGTLGYFGEEEDAARAYDVAALKHFGEFAC